MKGVGRFVSFFSFVLSFLSFSLPLSSVRSFTWKGRGRRFWDRVLRENRDRGFRVSKNGNPAQSCKASLGWVVGVGRLSLRSSVPSQFAHLEHLRCTKQGCRRTFREMELFVARNDGETRTHIPRRPECGSGDSPGEPIACEPHVAHHVKQLLLSSRRLHRWLCVVLAYFEFEARLGAVP